MATKTFTTYKPEEEQFIELEGADGVVHKFKLNPSLPGDLVLDFMYVSGTEDTSELAKAIRAVLDAAVVDEQKEEWVAFSKNPANGVTITVLSEIVGHVTAVLSGNPPDQE